jgi:hypothetical protein
MEYLALLNILDTLIIVNTDSKKQKPKPYPRPFDKSSKAKSISNNLKDDNATVGANKYSREKAIEILNNMNPR